MSHIMAARARRRRSHQLFNRHIDIEVEKLRTKRKALETLLERIVRVGVTRLARMSIQSGITFEASVTIPDNVLVNFRTSSSEAFYACRNVLRDKLAKKMIDGVWELPEGGV